MLFILIATHIIAFVAGGLVFRNNSTAANKAISTVQSDATKVASVASTVAADVKKA
jgi:hypothetical protein